MTALQVPVHPGEILKYAFMDETGPSAGRLARHLNVPRTRIERLVNAETSMTIDAAGQGFRHHIGILDEFAIAIRSDENRAGNRCFGNYAAECGVSRADIPAKPFPPFQAGLSGLYARLHAG